MRFKVGDKVNFLNESGGGTVTKIIDSKLVKVETADGFELPVLSSELIIDQRSVEKEETDNLFSFNQPSKTSVKEEIKQEEEDNSISDINPWGNIREEKGIYLAFEPHDQQWLLTGSLDVYLINHTSYDILYSLFFEINNSLEGVDFSSVPPNSKIVIDTISREELENWTNGYIQVLFHSDSPQKLYYPLHSSIDLKVNRFFKEGSYKSNSLLQEKALILNITNESSLETVSGSDSEKKFGSKTKASVAEALKDKPLIEKHRTAVGEATVDLHIAELVDNISGMSSSDMLLYQKDYFKKTLDSAIAAEYNKVTYIHGVGNGVLKNEIIKELDNYENTENQMASITKFGVGALDIRISYPE
ncbi:MAG: hypothetical protein C0598_13250 [Marinilabiliales bacterium]|nr:MAG: hypothetical protein C0598_13250 [Marinilabiliales bacterium]